MKPELQKKPLKKFSLNNPLPYEDINTNGKNRPTILPSKKLIKNILFAFVIVLCIIIFLSSMIIIDRDTNKLGIAKTFDTLTGLITNNHNNKKQNTDNNKAITHVEKTEDNVLLEEISKEIDTYYKALQDNNANTMKELGYSTIYNAINHNLGKEINWNLTKYESPDVKEMPEPIGTYANYKLYNLAGFYKNIETSTQITSTIYKGPIQGWIYYNGSKWVIVDPLYPYVKTEIPTQGVIRQSQDGQIAIGFGSNGTLANPWWAINHTLGIVSNNSQENISVELNEFDKGITILNDDFTEFTRDTIPAGTTSYKKNLYIIRGDIKEFPINQIGMPNLKLTGELSPFYLKTSNGNIYSTLANK